MAAKGYHTATKIINEACAGVRDWDLSRKDEAAMYFGRGYRDFKLFHAGGEIKEKWQTITSINTVPFPEDLLRLVSVGIVSDREFFSFTNAGLISLPSDPLDSTLFSDREEDETIRRTLTVGYGAKGTNAEYYYREDRPNRRIVLSRMAVDKSRFADRSEVLFRYVSTGLDNLNNTYIADDAANLLISYIEWKLVASMPEKYDRAFRFDKKEEYLEAKNMYETLEFPSLEEMADMIYESSSQNVRRV